MEYFFILGSNPALSIAELLAVFSPASSKKIVGENALILDINEDIFPLELIKKLGGTIKIGILKDEVKTNNKEELLAKIIKFIDIKKISGKFNYGISYYGNNQYNLKPLAMAIKKYLRRREINSRWVSSSEPVLSSVVVEQNKLVVKGMEAVILKNNQNNFLLGQTLTVQPFKELSFRDYGRPKRDDRSGMIPPKLAQIMINLSKSKITDNILDPFCGSGTIITEAMLMGYEDIIGSDISEKAVHDTKENIEWMKDNYQLKITNFKLLNKSVFKLSKFIKPNSVKAIITEPYLGPQRGSFDVLKIIKDLEDQYAKSLHEFKKIIKEDGRVVMVWPVFNITQNMKYINPKLNEFRIVNPISSDWRSHRIIKLTNRNTIIYGRPGQKIWREIVILKK